MNLDIKKIGFAILAFACMHTTSRADVWKPMNSGLHEIPLISADGVGYVAVITGGKKTEKGKTFNLNIWNGFSWLGKIPFITDSNANIRAMETFNGSIYIAGVIEEVHGLGAVHNIFRFNLKDRGFQKITKDGLVNDIKEINDLAVFQNSLVVGGTFSKYQSVLSNNVILFNGLTWKHPGLSFGMGVNGPVNQLLVHNDTLFMGGIFKSADQLFSQYYAAYYREKWYRYENTAAPLSDMVHYDNYLVTTINDGGEKQFAKISHSSTTSIDEGIENIYLVKSMIVYGGHIWAAGLFQLSGSDDIIYLIRYENGKWVAAPGSEYLTNITSLTEMRERLFGFGRFVYSPLKLKNSAEFAPKLGVITGKVFYDKNTNCTFDSREEFLTDQIVVIKPGNRYAKPDENGDYIAFLPEGEYEVSAVPRRYWSYSPCHSAIKLKLASGTIAEGKDLPMTYTTPVEDISVDLTALGGWRARTGSRNFYALKYANQGSEKVNTGKVTLQFNANLQSTFVSSVKPDSLDNGKAVWLYENLSPGEARNLSFSLEIPESFPDTEVSYTAAVNPTANEQYTDDNQSELDQEITDSTFGNEKQIFPAPQNGMGYASIAPQQREIQFNINFANYSYDTVRTIYVVDTLDTDLDIQFIQETGASHNYTTKVFNGPPGSNTAIVVWAFNDINLTPNPDRISDKPNYAGYIGFKFRFNEDLEIGTVVQNRAEIIFDYEHSELTNQVEGRVEDFVSVQNPLSAHSALVFPNPASDVIHVFLDQESLKAPEFYLIDMMGRISEVNATYSNGNWDVDVSHVPAGTYILKFGNNGTVTQKRVVLFK